MKARHLILTGGSGYLGARLVETALAQGRMVTLLGRQLGSSGTRHVPWTLGAPFPDAALDRNMAASEQVLVHLAHDWRGDETINVEGSVALFATAGAAGVDQRIFISSQSAREGALNRYGRMKWVIESRIEATSLRVGLIYGGSRKAMYGMLCRLARFPVLPMVDPHRTVQPIHLDEVVSGILAAADSKAGGVLGLAGPQPIAFGAVLRQLAISYGGRRLAILPVPLRLALFVCDLSAHLPLIPTVDRERVLGLAGTEPMDCAADIAELGLHVRPIDERLAAEPAGRRAALAEARAFLSYATGAVPGPALLRRYARAIPEGAIDRPQFLLRWREPIGARSLVGKRLRLAARIAEASAPGEAAMADGSRFGRIFYLCVNLGLEVITFPSRFFSTIVAR